VESAKKRSFAAAGMLEWVIGMVEHIKEQQELAAVE